MMVIYRKAEKEVGQFQEVVFSRVILPVFPYQINLDSIKIIFGDVASDFFLEQIQEMNGNET